MQTTTPGAGPYRTSASPPPNAKPPRRVLPIAITLLICLSPIALLFGRAASQTLPAVVLPSMSDGLSSFPPFEPELPISTPLAPLLAADAPEALSIVSPGEGANRIRRGESYDVHFNRPMVRGVEVGRALDRSPLVIRPRIAGTTRWINRSTLAFTPDPHAFDRSPVAHVTLEEGLASLDGESLFDETPRVIVLDGTPRLITHEMTAPVGAPVLLTFDAPVRTAELAQDLIAYEQGGGARSLPLSVTYRGAGTEEGQYLVAVRPTRALEAGARIAIAVAPRWMQWESSQPMVMDVALEPRPRIDGVGCAEQEWGGSYCAFGESPGAIVDIETDLTLRSTHALGDVAASAVQVTPPVTGLAVEVRGSGDEQRRHLAIHAEWDPDQVYEVRIGELSTERGEHLVRLGPLAVRSAGHPPQVIAHSGVLMLERDAAMRLPFRTIHPDQGRVLRRAVATGDEIRALLHPATYVLAAAEHDDALAPLAPNARANRWGNGAITIAHDGPHMEVIALQPGTRREPTDLTAALMIASDIGVSTIGVPGGVLVWLTSMEHGTPIAFANVRVGTHAYEIGHATTDAHGAAYIEMGTPVSDPMAVIATTANDRTIVGFDPRNAVGPASLGILGGEASSEDGVVRATVITDRGAYRPQETLHALAIVRHVEGATMTVPPRRAVTLRLMSPVSPVPVAMEPVRLSAAGVASATFELPSDAALGDYRVEALLDDRTIGAATATVAEYREPRFRVDLDAPADGTLHEGDPLHVAVHGRYLFGARLSGASARYSIVRGSVVGHGVRWHDVSFAPISSHAARATLAEGSLSLDSNGEAAIDATASLGIPARTRLEVEVEVTDESGESTTAHRSIVTRPAEIEVGVRRGDAWSALGRPVAFDVIAVDASDEPIVSAPIEARVVRESQQGYYEWEESDDGGGFRLRHGEGSTVVHRCALRSASDFVRCAYTPDRAGSYVLEAEAHDAHGRRSIASYRVYVTGPDGAPDRDPPGSPVELTPDHERYDVGDEAEIAFESPFAGRAMLTVETDRVLDRQPIDVVPGGNRVRVRITDAMVPNAFVSIVLVRPRTGPPPTGTGRLLDLDAPDLRIGAVELRASPHPEPLTVTLDAAARALPSTETPIGVRVTNADGAPQQGVEVALWAVDEGTLRVTDWSLPEATSGLFVRRAARFGIDDVRRFLVSRLPGVLEPGPSGDGGYVDAVMQLASRERYEPTPLFTASLVTDADGRVRTNVSLPDRVTEYRIVAVAVGGAQRFGRAEGSLVSTRPLVVRPALPRFLTEGDEVELAAFVHDEARAPIDATVLVRAFGEEHALGVVHVEPGSDARVAARVTIPIGAAPTPIEFVARSGEDEHHVARTLDVMPRGRWVRARAMVMGVTGERSLSLDFPTGTSQRGAMRAVVSLHPFIAADGLADDLQNVWIGGGELDAAVVLGLASHVRLGGTLVLRDSESTAREGAIRSRLRALQRYAVDLGGYSTYGTWASADARLTAAAIRARIAARDAGMLPSEGPAAEATERAADALLQLVRSGQVGASYGYGAGDRDLLAMCLHVLALAGRHDEGTFAREFAGRELLSPYALAHLALAAEEGDRRRDTLVVLALSRFHRDPDHGPRFEATDTSTLSALLVAAASAPAGYASISRITSILLDRSADGRESLSNPFATAEVIDAFARVVDRFVVDGASPPTLSLDGRALTAAESSGPSARFMMPFAELVSGGTHAFAAHGVVDRPVYAAVEARWAEPLTSADDDARGGAVTLHRTIETPAGAAIPSGAHVPLGALVRVRLFIHTERSTPEWAAVRDPHPAGFEVVDTGLESTPRSEIASLVGMGPDDTVIDVRARHALNSVDYIRSHEHAPHASTYQLRAMGPGLYELTYALRASTPGTFVAPPASIEALRDVDFVARSEALTLTVDP